MRIAFLGLGNMGAPIARNLARAGHQLTVFNRTQAKAEPLRKEGARVAASASEAVADAEILVSMLADDTAVSSTLREIFDHLRPEAVHVSASTISVALSRELEHEHEARRQRYLAAPVIGRPEAAEQKKLWIIAAGRPEVVECCRPVLEAVGQGITVVGEEPWRANLAKIGVNFVLASMLETLAEVYALVEKHGMDAERFLELLNGGLLHSPVVESYGRRIANRQYSPAGFSLRLGLKDAKLALAAGEGADVPLPAASLLRDKYLEALALGQGDLDWSSIAEIARLAAGVGKTRPAGRS